MKKQYLIHILTALLLSVQTIQAQEKRLPSELEINLTLIPQHFDLN